MGWFSKKEVEWEPDQQRQLDLMNAAAAVGAEIARQGQTEQVGWRTIASVMQGVRGIAPETEQEWSMVVDTVNDAYRLNKKG